MNEAIKKIEDDLHRQVDFLQRYWKLIGFLAGISLILYTTVQDVKAHGRWILRADQVLFATFVNSMLACVKSGETHCVKLEDLESGKMQLEPPKMMSPKE